jgi:2'-5' RNA ligase
MSSLRLFIAVDFSEDVVRAAAEVGRQMRRTLDMPGTRISWVKPENLHLTLKFLGDIEEETVPLIREALDAAAARHGVFGVCVRGARTFPGGGKPRVIWLGLREGADRMTALAADIERELCALGCPRDERGFRPHLTIARVKVAGRADYAGACRRVDDRDAGACKIDHVTLYSSTLDPKGAVYTVQHRAALKQG